MARGGAALEGYIQLVHAMQGLLDPDYRPGAGLWQMPQPLIPSLNLLELG